MECRAVVGSLSDYLDGREMWLSGNEIREIESHLAGCPTCQSVKLELTEIKMSARELPLHTPPRAMWTRIVNEIEAELKPSERPTKEEFPEASWWERLKERRFTFTLPQVAGAGALAAALIVFGLFSFSGQNPGQLNLINIKGAISGAQAALLPGEDQIKAEIERRLALINSRKFNWDPQARAAFDLQLNKIEESLKTCRQALQSNPGDKVQQQVVRALYNEKRQLLDDVERLKW